MKKFLTFILKIVVLLAFVGIIAFGTVAIINTSAKIDSAYNTISSAQEETPYYELGVLMQANVKTSVSGGDDEYITFLNGAMVDLNSAINYYVDYLVMHRDMDKNKQIELKDYYGKYKSLFEQTKRTYNEHVEWYVDRVNDHDPDSVHHWTDVEKLKYITNNQSIVSSYADCYKAGSDFFWLLCDTTRTITYGSALNYKAISDALVVSYADRAVSSVFGVTKKTPSTCAAVTDYQDIRESFDVFDESDVLTNSSVNTFVSDMNKIDMHRFVNDYDEYLSHSADSLKTHISRAKTFVDNNF